MGGRASSRKRQQQGCPTRSWLPVPHQAGGHARPAAAPPPARRAPQPLFTPHTNAHAHAHPPVVRPRVDDHKLARVVHHPDHGDGVGGQQLGRHQQLLPQAGGRGGGALELASRIQSCCRGGMRKVKKGSGQRLRPPPARRAQGMRAACSQAGPAHLVPHELGAGTEQVLQQAAHQQLKALAVGGGHHIPASRGRARGPGMLSRSAGRGAGRRHAEGREQGVGAGWARQGVKDVGEAQKRCWQAWLPGCCPPPHHCLDAPQCR